MKKILFFMLLLLFISCAKEEPALNGANKSTAAEINELQGASEENTAEENALKENITEKRTFIRKEKNGKEYLIEIVGITETGGACFLKVNGEPVIIDEGETSKADGLVIFLADITDLRSLENADICKLVIT